MPGAVCDAPEGWGRARRVRADAALDQAPGGFDGTDVGRIRRQKPPLGSAGPDEPPDRGGLVSGEIVEEHDVAGLQPRRQAPADPADDRVALAMALWSSLSDAEREGELALSDEEVAEIDRRWAEHLAGPGSGVPWSGVPWSEVRRKLIGSG